jgi:2-polyprenyl-6-methoxyphenol hydroxylase-like FAD-dependent oxidoreductase
MRNHSVIVVGAGPTGLMLAGELALAGVDVGIVERRRSQDLAGLRAGGLHIRTLEVLDQRGIADRFIAQGRKHPVAPFAGTMLDLSDLPTRHNYYLALWQSHIERTLAEWVAERGVPVYRGGEVTSLECDASRVEARLADGSSLRSDYLVGCDGGRSVVRKAAGIEFPGWDPSTSYLIAEIDTAETPTWGLRRGERGVNAIGRLEEGPGARVVLSERQLVISKEAPTLEEVREALRGVYGTDFGLRAASYISRFTDMARQAAVYRRGRVLLAGDAAHVHSPVGGQGLNLGIQDAFNLGWKLARVVQGACTDLLLDTYQHERHPVGARVLRNTLALTALERGDDGHEALRAMTKELMESQQARQRYLAMVSGLDIRYGSADEHPLLGRRMPDLEVTTAEGPRRIFSMLHAGRPVFLNLGAHGDFDIARWADRVSRVDGQYTGAWMLPASEPVGVPTAVLIRPDGHVAWVSQQSAASMESALNSWFGPARL